MCIVYTELAQLNCSSVIVLVNFCHLNAILFNQVDSSTSFAHLSSLDVRKLTGPYDLSYRFLKEVACEIAEPLTSLINYWP